MGGREETESAGSMGKKEREWKRRRLYDDFYNMALREEAHKGRLVSGWGKDLHLLDFHIATADAEQYLNRHEATLLSRQFLSNQLVITWQHGIFSFQLSPPCQPKIRGD